MSLGGENRASLPTAVKGQQHVCAVAPAPVGSQEPSVARRCVAEPGLEASAAPVRRQHEGTSSPPTAWDHVPTTSAGEEMISTAVQGEARRRRRGNRERPCRAAARVVRGDSPERVSGGRRTCPARGRSGSAVSGRPTGSILYHPTTTDYSGSGHSNTVTSRSIGRGKPSDLLSVVLPKSSKGSRFAP